MDSATCNVVYVDRNIRDDTKLGASSTPSDVNATLGESPELQANLRLLIDAFGEVHVCASGNNCISQLFDLQDASMIELKPTLVLIATPHEQGASEPMPRSRDPSPHSRGSAGLENDGCLEEDEEDLVGVRLLQRIVYETHSRNISKLVVPIPIVTFPTLQSPTPTVDLEDIPSEASYADYLGVPADSTSKTSTSRGLLRRCLDSGAVDVLASPFHIKTLTTLEVHAYRAHKEALREQQMQMEFRKGRKRSWVGIHEEKPFAYLREAMVSGLMNGICKPGSEDDALIGSIKICVAAEQRLDIADAVGKWDFCAHNFTDDQLVVAASLMFKHAFCLPELERWRISTEQLTTFLVACRAAYNTFVPYHNFRHAVDVLQASFNFLIHVGALPPYPPQSGADVTPTQRSPLASLLRPFEALTLLVSAIGHDVGHPGVNNGFLVVLNAPLAQLYNDRSVLESFHCAAYSQILRRYWPKVFDDTKMRSLMISSILATDMGLHFDYMKNLKDLQAKLMSSNAIEGWDARAKDKEIALLCGLLIKCADISNVARSHSTALKWMNILNEEFSRQASMEKEIGIPSSLIAEPKNEYRALAKSQLGFMNLFAIPLFQGVADILPDMQYLVEMLSTNKVHFEDSLQKIEDGATTSRAATANTNTTMATSDTRDSSSSKTLDSPQTILDKPAEATTAGSSPPEQRPQIPNVAPVYKEVNGISDDFDTVAHFSASDPFQSHDDTHMVGRNGKQRSSETTEGSSSLPYSGEWASHVTSATTGKMPLSPSTQGTSIISQDSIDHSHSAPATSATGTESNFLTPPLPPIEPATSEESIPNGSLLKPEKSLKKRPSRFRMQALGFFRRNKGSSSPSSSGECGG